MKGRISVVLVALSGLIGWQMWSFMNERPKASPRPRGTLQSRPTTNGDSPRPISGPAFFQDDTERVRLDFRQAIGPLGTYFVPEINGSGGAMFDYDSDGDLDVLLINSGRSPKATGEFPAKTRTRNALFRQEPDGTFSDVSAECGLGGDDYGIGCAVADVDNDGDLDVYVTNYGTDRLYLNSGNGSFVDASQLAHIRDDDWGTCAAFFDYDRDGWLDLFVANYTSDPVHGHSVACGITYDRVSYCGPHKFFPTIDRLYHNEGVETDASGQASVRFTDVTVAAGLQTAKSAGFGVLCVDFTGDHWPDIYVANDMLPNRLWVNQRDGTFREEAAVRGAALSHEGLAQGSMGVSAGDIDHDSDLDLVVSNLVTEFTALYTNDGNGNFSDSSRNARIWQPTRRHTGWGLALVDLDHDGDLDLPQVNGFVVPRGDMFPPHGADLFQTQPQAIADPATFLRDYYDANSLLLNAGDGTFIETAGGSKDDFLNAKGSARALIYGDIDHDGDIDLIVTNVGESVRLYRNQSAKTGHWLLVRAIDPRLNRDAYGAEVIVSLDQKKLLGVVNPSSSYLASNSIAVHFGLGEPSRFSQVQVRWPDGRLETFPGGDADQVIELRRGEGQSVLESEN